MALSYEFTVGKKPNSTLVYADKHLYNSKSKSNCPRMYYGCYKDGCSAKIKIVDGICSYQNSSHIHGTQETMYKQLKLNAKINERCEKEKKRPRDIFDEECSKDQDSAASMQFGKRQRTYQRHQSKGIPKNPKTLNDVKEYFEDEVILNKIGRTLHKEPKKFYQFTVITSLFAYVVFASESILENLPEILNMRIDGTFKVVPAGPFNQLLIISIDLRGHTFPVFYILLSRKTQAAYTHLLRKLDEKWKLRPVTITTDYEKGLKNALKKQYPAAKLISCWFHFAQALIKRAKKISGFLNFLKSDNNAKKLFRKFLHLPLIREDKIIWAFRLFKSEANNFGTRFNQFLTYYENQWIVKEGPASICVYLLQHRTNNLLESYNSNLKAKIPTTGCFFNFIELLRSEELIKSRDYAITRAGGTEVYPNRRNKYVERDEFIRLNQMKFENAHLNLTEFFEKLNQLDEDDEDEDNIDNSDSEYDVDTAIDPLCMICNTNNKSTLLEPCNHLKFCKECVLELMVPTIDNGTPVTPICPQCDLEVTGYRFVYF